MNFEVDDTEGNQALDYNQLARQRDFGVDNGCGVSINTGTLGSGNNTLTVAAGDIMFNGSSVSVSSQSVDIDTGGTNPRQDVVYLDSTGSAVVSTGTPEAVFPSDDDLTTFEYQRPAPSDLSGTNAVVLCAVWVAAGASSISSSKLNDRRVSSTASFTSVDTEEAFIGQGVGTTPKPYRPEIREGEANVHAQYDSYGAVEDAGMGGLNLAPGSRFGGITLLQAENLSIPASTSSYQLLKEAPSVSIHHPPGTIPIMCVRGEMSTANGNGGQIRVRPNHNGNPPGCALNMARASAFPFEKKIYMAGSVRQKDTTAEKRHPTILVEGYTGDTGGGTIQNLLAWVEYEVR